jgi:hypothetical protein
MGNSADEPKDIADLLRKAVTATKNLLKVIDDQLHKDGVPVNTISGQSVTALTLDVGRAIVQLEVASDAAVILSKQLTNLHRVTASPQEEAAPTLVAESVTTLPLSVEARRRMASMSDAHGVSQEDALERCIATQFYLDQKKREGWTVMLKRGRERRQVVLGGSGSPGPAGKEPGRLP